MGASKKLKVLEEIMVTALDKGQIRDSSGNIIKISSEASFFNFMSKNGYENTRKDPPIPPITLDRYSVMHQIYLFKRKK